MDPRASLEAGAAILEPLFTERGWDFSGWSIQQEPSLLGQGPQYAMASFSRAERRVELQFRYSLGPVTYSARDAVLPHQAYLDALGVPQNDRAYPGYSSDSVDEFRQLRSDLERFLGEFLDGDATVFAGAAEAHAVQRAAQHRRDMAAAVGDESARRRARDLFRKQDYSGSSRLLRA